ncbi:unnamed protein product [Tuber melanosporum]|uniref:(Perigord truffle) hypothetical protein n=1 Tax=Tuber melanosporum (strain Mel28) TaxID=656061 RepID=D5G5T1_TUBMM|nr:uncharacterized protein GSTUM_00001467001 [Tuber melanosporum]CAZ79874.1 unnamed protein product [Tuber melanosporum]
MYLCKYRWSYRGVRRSRMGGFFFLIFSLQSCLHFFRHWVGAFSFFIQTGFYGVLHIKHVSFFFLFHIFYFRVSPAKTTSIRYLASFFTLYFFRLAGRIFFMRKKEKEKMGRGKGKERLKERDVMDGRKGKGGRRNHGSVPFSLVG